LRARFKRIYTGSDVCHRVETCGCNPV
jgi:hypothetical protein